MLERLWVRRSAPDTGRAFFTFVVKLRGLFEKTVNKRKRGRKWQGLKITAKAGDREAVSSNPSADSIYLTDGIIDSSKPVIFFLDPLGKYFSQKLFLFSKSFISRFRVLSKY